MGDSQKWQNREKPWISSDSSLRLVVLKQSTVSYGAARLGFVPRRQLWKR